MPLIESVIYPQRTASAGVQPMSLINVVGDTAISYSGYINEYSAMSIPSFHRGVRFLTSVMATFDWGVHIDSSNKGRVRHPAGVLMTRKMSDIATPYKTLETWFHHAVVWGNGYLYVKRDKMSGKPIALFNINPEITTPFLFEGEKYFYVNAGKDNTRVFANDDVLHVSGLGFNGLVGYPLVQLMRQSLEVGKYAERHASNFFKKGTFVRGAIEIPGVLTDAQLATMRESLRNFKGLDGDSSLEYMLLQAGAKLSNNTLPNDTAELLATRKWSVIEVAQILGVPPHILYELSHGRVGTIQQLGDELVRYTFSPWIVQAEQELTGKLFTVSEQEQGYYLRCHTESLLKADPQTLSDQILKEVNGGIRTLNEGRAVLELPPVGPEGDKLRVPVSFPTAPNGGEDTTTGIAAGPVSGEDDTSTPDAGIIEGDGSVPAVDVPDALPGSRAIDPQQQPPNYESVIEPLILDACNRVERKTDKAFANREGKIETPWLNVFAQQQRNYVIESFGPLTAIALAFGRTLDTSKIAARYETAVKRLGATGAKESLLEISNQVINGQE